MTNFPELLGRFAELEERLGVDADVAAAEFDAMCAAFDGARCFALCLVNGLRIAGPGETQ